MKPTTKIIVDGTVLNDFSHLSLTQKIYEHHSFEIVIGHEVMEELGGHTLDKSKDWVGKSASITLGENDFIGIVTSVNMVHNHGMFGDLVIRGYSNTILLESGKHLFSWTEKSLKDIVKETIDVGGIQSEVNPEYQDTIGYISQHQESHYTFLKRIACQYHEWMFYNGEKLIFGKPDNMPTIPLAYGTDMDNIQVSVNMRPVKSKGFSYHSLRDEKMDGNTKDRASGLDELGKHGFSASSDSFRFTPHTSLSPRIPDKANLDDTLERMQYSKASNLSVISGSSSKQELRPGVIADIKANIFDNRIWSSKTYGQYLITSVHHHATGDYVYSNHFEGIPAGVKVLPEPDVPMPVAYPQIAAVISNSDPKQKGRIQVQFQWQEMDGLNTNWIRMMTPDAGKSDLHSKNRGHVFIPEVGDQVMVGYRYGDSSRPFVLGSMFHGVNGAGGSDKNVIKSIITRSGHELVFDDTDGGQSITITDKKGNHLIIDTEGETISINALKNININAGENINITAGKNITVSAGENIDESAGQNITTNAGANISITASEDFKQKSTNYMEKADGEIIRTSEISKSIAQNVLINSTKEDIQLQSAKSIVHNSNDKTNLF